MAQNSRASPLLRLPAEIRNKIWRMAYGDMEMCVEPGFREIPYAHLDPAIALRPVRKGRQSEPPSLVSRQYWAEASAVYLGTCSFVFSNYRTFRTFVASGGSIIARVRRIAIYVTLGYDEEDKGEPYFVDEDECDGMDWADALAETSTARLPSLEGVSVRAWFLGALRDLKKNEDPMFCSAWT